MRTSSFSNPDVVSTISRYFVPVWMSNDDYGLGKKSKTDAAELARIKRETASKKLNNGAVNVFLVDPEGNVMDTMIVSKAMEPQNLLPMLRKVVADKGLQPRDEAAVKSTATPQVPDAEPRTPGAIALHVFTRYFPPAEQSDTMDLVELTRDECSALAPPPNAQIGTSWDVAATTVEKMFAYCYPAVCHYEAKASKVHKAALKATVTAATPNEIQITLSGDLDMDHSRDGNIDGRITAKVLGLARFDTEKKSISSIQIVSENAEYVWHWNGKPSRYRIGFVIDSAKPAG